jgi:hypothetical protein
MKIIKMVIYIYIFIYIYIYPLACVPNSAHYVYNSDARTASEGKTHTYVVPYSCCINHTGYVPKDDDYAKRRDLTQATF